MTLNIDMDKVEKLINDGYISVRPHPTAPLFIYNYTRKCQYDWYWTPETIACRGLILDKQGKVVARPFPKFFTVDQYKDLRNKVHNLYEVRYRDMYKGEFTVTDKADGSLGILHYHPDHGLGIATRGSFESPQAKHATEILREKYGTFPFVLGNTYLFEIIYPENRIVVDYGSRDELLLLTVLDNETGEDVPDLVNEWREAGHPTVESFNFESFADILDCQGAEEGFVVKFDNGVRVKVKFEEYLRLHHILTSVSARTIWERLSNEEGLDDIIELVPDEFYDWVRSVEAKLLSQYSVLYANVISTIRDRENCFLTRKEIAIKYKDYKYKGILFLMLDGNKAKMKEAIWKLIRPEAEKPFEDK